MSSRGLSLDDKYEAETGKALLNGIEALVRLPLDQVRQDRRNGLESAGFISGYRGSPLGGYDQRLMKAKALLDAHHIRFQPGLNEDLAATAVWGTQQVNLHPGAKTDGVFGIWYGKAPGVDRSGDVFKHANMTGTARNGGVLAIAGDDPLAKSSSLPSQSEFALIDAEMPILTPSDIQDVLDLGLHGLAMSRYTGLWTGLIALADLMDGSATVNIDPGRFTIELPPEDDAPRHISLDALQVPNRIELEETLRRRRLPAALRYAWVNGLNKVVAGCRGAELGIAASGKSWSALLAALDLLGLGLDDAEVLGLRLMKVSMPWPLEPEGIRHFALGLKTILVVEGKRPLIEMQVKDQLYHLPGDQRPAVVGKTDHLRDTSPFGCGRSRRAFDCGCTGALATARRGDGGDGGAASWAGAASDRAWTPRHAEPKATPLLLRLPAQPIHPRARRQPIDGRDRVSYHDPMDGWRGCRPQFGRGL